MLEELGRGRFGTVFRCFHRTSNKFYAAKLIEKRRLLNEDRRCIDMEAKAMSFLSPHPNILQIMDAFEDADSCSIVLELCQPHTLLDRIAAQGPLTEPHAASLLKQLLEAVAHCHAQGLAHRDIKPENILFDEGNKLKLSDFGSAEWLGEGSSMSGVVGTPYYVAPEVIMGREYDEKVDVWSSGVILYAMLAGFPPFYGESAPEIFESVLRANLRFPSLIFSSVSAPAKDLLRKMISRDPSSRISAHQALRHPWILTGPLTTATISNFLT